MSGLISESLFSADYHESIWGGLIWRIESWLLGHSYRQATGLQNRVTSEWESIQVFPTVIWEIMNYNRSWEVNRHQSSIYISGLLD